MVGGRKKLPRLARAGALVLALGGTLGCTAYATLKNAPVDCTVENAYEFKLIDAFDTPLSMPMWTSSDCTAGSSMTDLEAALPDGARCGSTTAEQIQASHNNDWGSLTGYNNFGPRDASAYEGISFWARTRGNSTNSFAVLLDDPNTGTDSAVSPPLGNCTVNPAPDAGACAAAPTTTIIDSMGNILSSGTLTAPPLPGECGNSYSFVVSVTGDWQLYTIPFGRFQQGALPNRVPNPELTATGSAAGTALLTSQLLNLTMRFPKAIDMDLWIDNLAFYRKKRPGGDGGIDAH